MTPGTPRTSFNSSRLVHLLAGLTAAEVSGPTPSLAERLGPWLGWADAISLSAVLAGPQPRPPGSQDGTPLRPDAVSREFTRVRDQLARAIDADETFAAPPTLSAEEPDFAPYRRSYQSHQRAMEAGIQPLRMNLRATLEGTGSPGLSRLAALDAVLDRALAARERSLLASVPALLEKHFKRLRKAHRDDAADPQDAPGAARRPPTEGWLAAYGRDVRRVLLAELDVRLQPVEGLIEALRQDTTIPP